MSDNKKYYYIRIKEDFYDSEEMKLLQVMDDGYLFSDILMKMYLKSLKNEGKMMFRDNIPYNAKMIATITGHSTSIVEKAIAVFRDLDLIEVLDNGTIYMLDIQLLIGKSSTEADRIKSYRNRIKHEKNKKLLCNEYTGDRDVHLYNTNVQMYEECTPETRDKSIEIRDKSIETKDKRLDRENEQLSSLSDEFCSYVVKLGFTLDSELGQALSNDIKGFGLNEVKNALSIAASKGKNYSYAKAILNNRKSEGKIKKGVKTFEDTRDSFLKNANALIEDDYNF